MEGHGKTQLEKHVGTFLASLMRNDLPSKNGFGWQSQVRRGDGCAARGRIIMNQIYFRPGAFRFLFP